MARSGGEDASDFRVRVVYVGLVRNSLGINEEEVELPPGSCVRDLLSLLVERHGADLRHSLFSTSGELSPLAEVLIGDQSIEELNGLDTTVDVQSKVHILVLAHPMAGG